jgi:hypothetical protein
LVPFLVFSKAYIYVFTLVKRANKRRDMDE